MIIDLTISVLLLCGHGPLAGRGRGRGDANFAVNVLRE